jgi:sec-independent protein translocase protein TatA
MNLCLFFTFFNSSDIFRNFVKILIFIVMILGITGPWQIILILAIVVLLFGGKKIPELMKGLGKGVKEFKDASKGENTSTEVEEKK